MSYFARSNERPSGILLPPVALSLLSIRDFQVARETRGVDEFGPMILVGGGQSKGVSGSPDHRPGLAAAIGSVIMEVPSSPSPFAFGFFCGEGGRGPGFPMHRGAWAESGLSGK